MVVREPYMDRSVSTKNGKGKFNGSEQEPGGGLKGGDAVRSGIS
jgi:hypothetical protein